MSSRRESADSLNEFGLIEQYFTSVGASASSDLVLGVGDDCALIQPPPGKLLCLSVDTVVEGVHFPQGFPPKFIAMRALGAALSDLAAMGASPSHFTLALTLPASDRSWLQAFSDGLSEMARACNVSLVGGDTARGPLAVSIQVHGWVEPDKALCRSGAQVGDLLFVSGDLGSAAGGLALARNCANSAFDSSFSPLYQRFSEPYPRLGLGAQLVGLASSCIDVSDGLIADARHISLSSNVQLQVETARVPMHQSLREGFPERAIEMALSGGDDYELLFTVPEARMQELYQLATEIKITQIGRVLAGESVVVVQEGKAWQCESEGYQHFE